MASDKRIHVTYDDMTREILEMLAKKEKRSLSEIVRNITEEWLELKEDEYWVDSAEAELQNCSNFLTHEQVWSNVKI
jgi:predicted DNA-binding protein